MKLSLRGLWLLVVLVLVLGFTARDASAALSRTGEWPALEVVSLSVQDVTRAQAVRALAERAGWSLVAQDLGDSKVTVDVKEQSAASVLELLLSDADYIAVRQGNLVSVARKQGQPPAVVAPAVASVPLAAAPPKPAHPAAAKGEDRFVKDEDHITAGEVVKDVFVWGGNVLIEGTVTGSVAVFGGSATLLNGAYVKEDVFAVGGTLDIQNGAQVDGEVTALAGKLHRGDQVNVRCMSCDDEPKDSWKDFFERFFGRLTGAALLWLVGAALIALALPRIELVRRAILERPLRCAGIGFAGFFATLLVLLAMAITLIGIPVAILGGLLAFLSVYGGFSVVLLTLGGVLWRGRSENTYLHLAIGCAVYFVVCWIPWINGIAGAFTALIAIGALIESRGAGVFARRVQG